MIVEDIFSEYSGDLVSGIYDEAGKIREFLKDMYTNYCLEYVLLGGDNTVLPIRYGFGDINDQDPQRDNFSEYIPTDLYYAEYNGDWNVDADTLFGEPFNLLDTLDDDDPEYESEVYVGRILCRSSEEVSNWTTKLKKYEINPGNGNGSYLTKSFMIQSDYMQRDDHAHFVASHLGDFNDTVIWEEIPSYDSPGIPSFPTGVDAVNEMNKNYGLISWFSHAGPGSIGIGTKGDNCDTCQDCKYNICALDSWDETNQSSTCIEEDGNGLDNLTNYDFPGIVFTPGCYSTLFDNDLVSPNTTVNLGQGWTTNTLAGGPAYLGYTRNSWGDAEFLYAEFADIIDNDGSFNLGKAEALSKQNYNDHYYCYAHTLIGCPETEIWTESPDTYNNVTITENGSSVTVSTGVSGSNICLMSIVDNGESYHELQTDVSSHTFTNVPFQYYVTVTKHDYYPSTLKSKLKCSNLS